MPTRAMCEYGAAWNKDPNMPFSDRQGLDSLSRMLFIDSAELAGILGEPHATVHRTLTGLLAEGSGASATGLPNCRRARGTT